MRKLLGVIAATTAVIWSDTVFAVVDESTITVTNSGKELDGATVSLTTTDNKAVKTETGNPSQQHKSDTKTVRTETGNPSTKPAMVTKKNTLQGVGGQSGGDAAIERALGTAIGLGIGIGLHGGFGRGGDHGSLPGAMIGLGPLFLPKST